MPGTCAPRSSRRAGSGSARTGQRGTCSSGDTRAGLAGCCREPRRIDKPQELLAGPERIESGWWDGADVARDYYLAREANGAQLWVFQDLRGGGWHVHGIWA